MTPTTQVVPRGYGGWRPAADALRRRSLIYHNLFAPKTGLATSGNDLITRPPPSPDKGRPQLSWWWWVQVRRRRSRSDGSVWGAKAPTQVRPGRADTTVEIIRPLVSGGLHCTGDANRCGHDVASSPALSSWKPRIRATTRGTWVDSHSGRAHPRRLRRLGCSSTTVPAGLDPREHGRQAARSKRDEPGGHVRMTTAIGDPGGSA
jgi:hypothetical protein